METTWDGLPISSEKPKGVAVIVYRRMRDGLEVLILHRAHHGTDYEGDWAWTPPSGARQPGEAVATVAKRELKEETGIEGVSVLTGCGSDFWFVYSLEVGPSQMVCLDEEHDRYEWVALSEAIQRCQPESVSLQLQRFADEMGGKG